MRQHITWATGLSLVILASGAIRAQDLVITEFMALNRSTLVDEDRDFPDWIEIYNPGAAPVDLEGWSLTDDPREAKWEFPKVEIGPGAFLVVFASGKDRRDPSRSLHTNFRLDREGEFVGLISPGSNLVSGYTFPEQLADTTYGVATEIATRDIVVAGAEVRYLVPDDNDLRDSWTELDFDDAAWATGPTGIGYDRKETPTYTDVIRSDVGDLMEDVNASIYLRLVFDAGAADLGRLLRLRMRYEDGYIAYLNGDRVAERNAPRFIRYSSRSSRARDESEALEPELFPLTGVDSLLEGRNVLALQALNDGSRSEDLLMVPEIETLEVVAVDSGSPRYFSDPTPAWPNAEPKAGIAPPPTFSVESGVFEDAVTVELSSDAEGAVIRYTIDQSEPTEESPLYDGPITIRGTVVLRARVFQPGLLPSVTVDHSYVLLDPDMLTFSSNLPVFVVNTFGRPIGNNQSINVSTPMHMYVLEPGEDGRARLSDAPHFSGNGRIKVRGSSTSGRDKASYNFEIQDEHEEDKDVAILGFPEESDYILYGAFNFDRAHIRNALMYELSNQAGRYAVRTRFCELFLNDHRGGDAVSRRFHYRGIYVFMEKIKRDPDRVDIAELLPEHDREPEITGGYILKIDRPDPGDSGFGAAGQTIRYVEPKEREITPAQATWIRNYFNDFFRALNGPNSADPELGYARYIEVESWIDHHILNVLAKNVDAFRLSGYFHKDRNGKIQMGPIWDFDRSIESTDGRDNDPRTWDGTGDATRFFQYPWWNQLFRDPGFWVEYRARWRELRDGPLSTENVDAVVDRMAAELSEAALRDAQKWRQIAPRIESYQAEINKIKQWLKIRSEWIDSQFIEPPAFSHPGGPVDEGFEVTISAPSGEIYYTLDGTDPMTGTRVPAPAAILYDGSPIVITENVRIRASARVSARSWSEIVEAIYITDLLPLVITELMYNPIDESDAGFNSTDLEYLEVLNAGDEPIDLRGVSFSGRIRFAFEGAEPVILEPGEYTVVAQDIEAFRFRYGDGVRVDGEYRGLLSNAGQEVELLGPLGEVVVGFTYDDAWYPETDGDGYSLVLVDPLSPAETWSSAGAWRPSLEIHGSPGRADTAGGLQLPADFDQDSRVTVGDAVGMLLHLFRGVDSLPCGTESGNLTLLDSDGDSRLGLSDGVHVLQFLFQSGPPPALGLECVPVDGCPEACGS